MKTTRVYDNPDGSASVWEYDTEIKTNGPVSVTEIPAGHPRIEQEKKLAVQASQEVESTPGKKVSKTKMRYLNPATGKEVGYVRAKNLGLI